MLSLFLGSSSEVIQVSENDAREIMENISHGLLECSTYVLDSKRHNTIIKSTPWGGKCSFILICWMDLDLIVARETIHERQSLVACTIINNLVNERYGEVVFGTSMIEIEKVNENVNSSLFVVNRDGVRYPRSVCDGLYESCSM
jgi:hypothetical protein